MTYIHDKKIDLTQLLEHVNDEDLESNLYFDLIIIFHGFGMRKKKIPYFPRIWNEQVNI